MTRKTTKLAILSLLVVSSATAIGNYVYAETLLTQAQSPARVIGPASKVTNLKATSGKPHDDGTADVTITFTTPTAYYDLNEYEEKEGLDELTKIVITQYNKSTWEYDIDITTIENPGIGVEISYTIENVASGNVQYQVTCYNSATESSTWFASQSVYTYVGYDYPSGVENIQVKNEYPKITISWDASATGYNGGYLDLSRVKYKVERCVGYDSQTIAEDITDTSLEDTLDEISSPTKVSYKIYAYTDEGSTYGDDSPEIIVGSAASLPFSESFEGGDATNLWASAANPEYRIYINQYVSSWGKYTPFGTYLDSAYDNDGGALTFSISGSSYADPVDCTASYTTSDISLDGATSPALSFYSYNVGNSTNKLKALIAVEQAGVKTTLKTIDYTSGDQGWSLVIIPLKDFVGKGNIKVSFNAECNAADNGFAAFDAIKIDELISNDIAITGIDVPTSVKSGSSYGVTVNIQNKGADEAKDFSIDLYVNDQKVDSKVVESLASGAFQSVTFSEEANNSYTESAVITAKVVFADDENADNNEGQGTITVKLANTPAPTGLAGEQADDNITLSWEAPDYQLPETEQALESFEDYAHGTNEIGSWTLFDDDDAHYTLYFTDYGLASESWQDKLTYRVIDQNSLTITDNTKWYGKPHSGNKYIVSSSVTWGSREDWLVSPELSGNIEGQTLEFYAASNHYPTDYWADDNPTIKDRIFVYASFTTPEKSAFTYKALCDADDKTKGYELQNALATEGADYEKITVQLPEGAKYFAIVVVTIDSRDSIVFFDDFSFETGQTGASPSLIGYDIYDGATKLNDEPVTETTYTVTNPTAGSHSYSVVAIYNAGTSEASAPVVLDFTGVSSISKNLTTVRAGVGEIIINAQQASLYDLAGRLVAKTTGNTVLSVARGTYIVRADGKSTKVLVR